MLGEVIGVARSERTLLEAVHLGAADRTTDDPLEAVADADLVYIATPVSTIARSITVIAPALRPGALVTDAGSTKREIVAAARHLPKEVSFVGGHPMAGSEQAGVGAARASLFHGRTYLLTPTPGADAALARFRHVVEAIGARPVIVDADTHDHMLAHTSHLPHLVAAALCRSIGETCAARDFVGNGLRDTTRIAEGPAEVWREILLTNADEVLNALEQFREEIDAYLNALDARDESAITRLLEDARECRMRMGD